MRQATFFLFFLLASSTLFSQADEQASSTFKKSMEEGAMIFEDFCSSCHMSDGKGQPKTYPPLAQSDFLMSKRTESIRGIKFGQQGEITVNGEVYNNVMAPLGLSDAEIADVMNYITNSWGNKNEKIITEEEVSKVGR